MNRLTRHPISYVLIAMLVVAAGIGLRLSDASEQKQPAFESAEAPRLFLDLLFGLTSNPSRDLKTLAAHWEPSFTPMAIESLRFFPTPALHAALNEMLIASAGEDHGPDLDGWWRWWWSEDRPIHPHYASFKSELYEKLDPRFAAYFNDERETTVRLDEARWGGVGQDGIPPLRQPSMLQADAAPWLNDRDIVFGISINGDDRAYPKRILAWHEMFVDTIGGIEIAGVYCTLCGAVIAYETNHEGTQHALGTSGFLYRSNKMMYDAMTQSLWSTHRGTPIVGPLVGRGIELQKQAVVTTTWGEWKRRHPDTTVLDVETGYDRDYGEGIAYYAYFATDELMFTVPRDDERLANKAEVLALRFPQETPGQENATLAIDSELLMQTPVYTDTLGDIDFVVLTDPTGANRVFDRGDTTFVSYDGDTLVTDDKGVIWTLSENAMTSESGERLNRLPAHRAFWFGWVAAFPDTELVSATS